MTRTSRRSRRKIVSGEAQAGRPVFQPRESEFNPCIPIHAAAFVVRHDSDKRRVLKAGAVLQMHRQFALQSSTTHVTGIKQLHATPTAMLT